MPTWILLRSTYATLGIDIDLYSHLRHQPHRRLGRHIIEQLDDNR